MKSIFLAVVAFAVLLSSGCATQQPRYSNPQYSATSGSNQSRSISEKAKCTIDGEDFGDITHEQCRRNRDARIVHEPAKKEFSVIETGTKVAEANDLWKWRAYGASPSTPKLCVVERKTGEATPPFCSELRELARNKGETRDSWKQRASSF